MQCYVYLFKTKELSILFPERCRQSRYISYSFVTSRRMDDQA